MLLQVQFDSKRVYYRFFVSSIVFWDEWPCIAVLYIIYIYIPVLLLLPQLDFSKIPYSLITYLPSSFSQVSFCLTRRSIILQ